MAWYKDGLDEVIKTQVKNRGLTPSNAQSSSFGQPRAAVRTNVLKIGTCFTPDGLLAGAAGE